jgi:thioredoxin reductase (NADPH)
MLVILKGEVEVSQHDQMGRLVPIVRHGPGAFMLEVAQLSGRARFGGCDGGDRC